MMKPFTLNFVALLALAISPFVASSQSLTIYDPQVLYDEAGGLFEAGILRHLNIEFEQDNYHEILSESFFNEPSLRIPATISMDGIVLDSVGVRYKGNSTFCLPHESGNVKLPYNLDMNHWISGQKLLEYKKLKLANAWLDPTYCKEFLASHIYRNYLPTPEVNLMALHTQGQYTGLYVNTESINKQFLDKHFNESDGALFKCDGAGVFCSENGGGGTAGGTPSLSYLGTDSSDYYNSYIIKSDHGWSELLALITALEFNPAALPDFLNIDRVLWAMAVNTVTSNLDTYNGYYVHNYYLYLDEEGRFQMIPWDFDNTFVGAILGFSFFNPAEVYQFDPFYIGSGPADDRPLINYLFNEPSYRKQYLAHIRTIMEESMDVAVLAQEIQILQDLANEDAAADPNSLFGMDLFASNVNEAFWANWGFAGILSTVEARMAFLSDHPEISAPAPLMGAVEVLDGVVQLAVANADSVQLLWTEGAQASNFQVLPMADDGTQGDAISGDGIFAVHFPPGISDGIKFYIRATNAEAMSLSPARAEYEYYMYGTTTGVDSWSSNVTYDEARWNLAPNPARHAFSLSNCPPFTPITILDHQGRVLHSSHWTGQSIDIRDWPTGIYWVRAGTPGAETTQKLIVQ